MVGYTKLFSSLIGSSIWRDESYATKIVWITMLALADKDGVVGASVLGLADFAKVTLEETEIALEQFKSPDKYSRTKDLDGVRIKEVDGGWLIVNHAKFRGQLSDDSRREYNRKAKQRQREREAVRQQSMTVNDMSRLSCKAEAEAEADLQGSASGTHNNRAAKKGESDGAQASKPVQQHESKPDPDHTHPIFRKGDEREYIVPTPVEWLELTRMAGTPDDYAMMQFDRANPDRVNATNGGWPGHARVIHRWYLDDIAKRKLTEPVNDKKPLREIDLSSIADGTYKPKKRA